MLFPGHSAPYMAKGQPKHQQSRARPKGLINRLENPGEQIAAKIRKQPEQQYTARSNKNMPHYLCSITEGSAINTRAMAEHVVQDIEELPTAFPPGRGRLADPCRVTSPGTPNAANVISK